ncbi:MAG TPA: nicotinamide-nucleotide amidase [Gammaproteobacteria bacterium]
MDLQRLSEQVGQGLLQKHYWLATAESCTGGWIAQCITDIAGSSHYFDRGFVTYSNEAKQDMLGVSATTLLHQGAVSEPAVREMALGALAHSRADIVVAVSGIAGPTGGTAAKPVGLVWHAWCLRNGAPVTKVEQYIGNRYEIRRQTVVAALKGLLELLS